jgi:predicted TIM-barrel fold metal-dependent hydrolase
MGIAKLMICMGLRFHADPTPDELRQDNDAVLSAVAHAPDRILGFVYLNPKHVVASLNELDRCVKNGPMVGVKLWIAIRCNHPDLDAIVRRANDLGVPILQHVYQRTLQNKDGESSPLDLSELAHRHPEATFIAAHTGNDWEQGIRAIRANKNVYCEICGSDPTAGMVEMAVRELGAERVLYGSDITGRSFASQLAKVTGANITAQQKSLILAGNLKRVLAPILAKKGLAQ